MRARIRAAGVAAMIGGLLWSIDVLVVHGFSYDKPSNGTGFYVLQVVSLVGFCAFLLAVQGLVWDNAIGTGRFGLWSLRIFQVGLALIMAGGLYSMATGNQDNAFFPLGGLSIAVTSILTGIAVVRAGTWTGARRFAPLLVGLYYLFGMMVPAIFASSKSGGPPPVLAVIWGAAWVVLGVAYLAPSDSRPAVHRQERELTVARS